MNTEEKKAFVKYLIPIIQLVIREFFTGGKTKLGVYILGVTVLSLNFFAGIDPVIASANPETLPTIGKIATGLGGLILSVGLGHDVIKKSKSILNNISDLF